MSSPSVLIVEDDPTLLSELTEYLSGQGFQVAGAPGVQAAEERLQNPFDLLVLDLNLPDGSGVELCKRLRPYLRSGIVICSGRSERELRLALLRGGADAFLVKPVDPEELAAVLTSVLRRVKPAVASPMVPSVPPPALWRLDRARQMLIGPAGTAIELTHAEMTVLLGMFDRPDRAAERQHLLDRLEAEGLRMTGARLETLVSRLRGKVLDASGAQLPVRASYGRGYIFAAHALII